MTARIDFVVEDQGAHPRGSLGELPPPWNDDGVDFAGVPLIGDHKTTKDIDAYAKRPEDLTGDGTREMPGDAQAAGYGAIGHVRSGSDRIDGIWSYSRTQGRTGALPVRIRWDLSSLEKALVFLLEDAAHMRRERERTSKANEIEPKPGPVCDAFGGCPFRSKCNLTDEQRMTALMAGNDGIDLSTLLKVSAAEPAKPNGKPKAPVADDDDPLAAALGAATTVAKAAPKKAAAPVDDDPLSAALGNEPKAAPKKAAPAADSDDPLASALGTAPKKAAPVEAPEAGTDEAEAATAQKLAARFFAKGEKPPSTASAAVLEAYARLIGSSNVNPDDAPPIAEAKATPVETKAAPVVEPVAEEPKKTRKKAAEPAVEVRGGVLDAAGDAIALARAAAIAAIGQGRYDFASDILYALVEDEASASDE